MKACRLLAPHPSIAILRMLMGIIFMLHGAARVYENSFSQFGVFPENRASRWAFTWPGRSRYLN